MAGGTGGHVYPALAVAEELRLRGWMIDWVGTQRGLESRVVPEHGIELHTLPVRGLRGKGILARVSGVLRLGLAMIASLALVARLKPDAALGMGGYAAGPAGLAMRVWRRPLVIHEQNAVAGTTNRLLAPFANRILCGFEGAFSAPRIVEVVGNPVRDSIFLQTAEKHYPERFTPERPLRLLVLGGSLGSAPINNAVPAAVSNLLDSAPDAPVTIRHQCGESHFAATQGLYAELAQAVTVIRFIEDMADAYRWADLVICRAGALTVSELAATGTPAILVPLPHAIDDHQTRNAEVLSAVGAAELLPQRDISDTVLADRLNRFLRHPERLKDMSVSARSLSPAAATRRVADVVEEVAHVA
ncbi:undecaprenyldiphospho-muramoylpentapeptide beta-N-acetylglucosaminyltransferase [Luminiphilus syltensis NOR5-1B]|uniref:UDP-N-acetylglucosamine--N-acetylmuramyl-(pentapeptide) pyrophosphoryl-undecaprenol N-acetylglucosamine transferase n=2 Tax=Luminiphilus TaxID=1341118 RepID=B8KR51_9GAMM|nr:undecaprenyldiphospho-muramoylpentapeptide beta-N-acetylglucosaminyltransferase [Luminiphilus syltensis NOR5-1B]